MSSTSGFTGLRIIPFFNGTFGCSRDFVAQRRGNVVELTLPVAPLGCFGPPFVAGPSLSRSRVHAVFKVFASAVLAANLSWLPGVAQVGPDAGRFLVGRPVLAVGNVSERQAQLQHEGPRLQAAGLGVLERPMRPEVLYDFQSLLNERVGVLEFLLGGLSRASRYRVKRAQRARPHEVEGVFGEGRVVPLQDVCNDRWVAFRIDVQRNDLPVEIAKGSPDGACAGK